MKQKRGQFFLLAAVIISVVIISLAATTNRAVVQYKPESFYDFSYQVERETGEVLNYEIYTNINGGSVQQFVSLLSEEISDENPDAEFIFVFGNNSAVTVA